MPSLQPMSEQGQALPGLPQQSDAPLIVYIDFKSPYAFLAVEPTRKMLAANRILADWRPFVLNIGSYLGTAKLAKDGSVQQQSRSQEQWSGVKYAYFDCRRYANLTANTIRGTVKIWDTNLPAIGMWWLKLHESLAQQNDPEGLLQRYIDAVYLPFWRREFDAEDIHAVTAALAQIGAPVEGFEAFAAAQGGSFNESFQIEAFNSGVYGVPTYLLPDQQDATGKPCRFFGREHLPRIQWLLTQGIGTAPDVAYSLPQPLDAQVLEKCASQPGVTAGAKALPVYFDFKSPNSYLALAELLAMRDHGITLQWHPFDHKPLNKPVPAKADDDRSVMHRRIRGEYIAADIQRYAPHPIKDIYLDTDCALANMGLLWVAKAAPNVVDDYVEAVFRALWREHVDIAQTEVVLELLGGVMGDDFDVAAYTEFAAGPGKQALIAAAARAADAGITYAPTMTLGDEPFQGRAQLPLLQARLLAGI